MFHPTPLILSLDLTDAKEKPLEFQIKWMGISDMHNTWNSLETLRTQKGFKKVENYIKKLKELDLLRKSSTRFDLLLLVVPLPR